MSKKDLNNASEEETYGKEFWEEYHNNTKEKKNNP
jgi:hypothetical protein